MLLSENEEDFELGKIILEDLGIKPSRLLNYNTRQSLKSDFKFRMVAGELKRYSYGTGIYYLGVDAVGNIIKTP